MKLIDGIHLDKPYLCMRRICEMLRDMRQKIGCKHVRTLMNKMSVTVIYSKPELSKRDQAHKVYPYLLRGMAITKANQAWAADITYIPMASDSVLVAVLDWASPKVLSRCLSNTREAKFWVEALEEAIARCETPGIFNTDQGS